ncbi:P-type conjugative transfer protein TrbL [Variovorax sp. V59]|uniref:P-type conjugative transfer protein TrbL n=1 Tax=unclassified Variovorax TaxID=663243 RepID=UPI0034E8B417
MKILTRTRSIALALLMMAALFSLTAHAAIDSAGVLDNVTARYQAQAATWGGSISAAATRLFWALALISMVWTFGMMALRKADIGEIFAELIRYVMFTGFFFFLLSNASPIATAIMNSLKQLAGDAAGVPGLTPSGIVDIGFKIFSKVIDNSSVWAPIETAIGAVIAILTLGMLALVAINMVVLLVSGWILAYAGIFFLGFGGSRWTSDMAINYYKTVLGIAASLMGMTLLVGIGQAVLNEYYVKMGDATLRDLAVILVVAGLLLYLVNKIPPLIAGIITGASVGGAASMGGAGTGTLMAAAAMAGAAAAGAMSVATSAGASAAGWGSAIKAAFDQAGTSNSNNTGVGGMPDFMAGGDGGGSAGASTSTPFAAAMGDSGGGLGSFGGQNAGWKGDTAPEEDSGSQSEPGSKTVANDNAPIGGGQASPPKNGDYEAATGGDSDGPDNEGGRSVLGALGTGIAAVAKSKIGSVMDAASHRASQTTGGRVAAEIRAPGSAAADRQDKADINKTKTVAGKAQAARAFIATGMASGGTPPAFTGDSLSGFNDSEKSVDAAAEISAFANRRQT